MFRYIFLCLFSIFSICFGSNPVLPKDNRALTLEEMDLANQMLDKIDYLIQARRNYEKTYSVDPLFSEGDNFWKKDESKKSLLELQAEAIIQKRSPVVLRNLKLFCPFFTGLSAISDYDKIVYYGRLEFDEEELERNIQNNLEKNGLSNFTYFIDMVDRRYRLPPQCIFQPPIFLGECGVKAKALGKELLINDDIVAYQERAALMQFMGIFQHLEELSKKKGVVKVLEIGGGYGALAYFIRQVFPHVQYTIIDLPESLLFSSLYLALNYQDLSHAVFLSDAEDIFDQATFRYVPHFASHQIEESFDLIINTLSMSEMTEYQVKTYLDLMKKKWLTTQGIFFEQNQNNNFLGWSNAEDIIRKDLTLIKTCRKEAFGLRQGNANIWKTHP